MSEELKIYPSARRNLEVLLANILVGLIFPIIIFFYLQSADFSLNILTGLLLIASFVIGVQILVRIAANIANILNKNPRIIFTTTKIEFNLPFIRPFSIPLSEIEIIYQFIGYAEDGLTFWKREHLVFILKNKSHSHNIRSAKLFDYFLSIVTPTGGSLISKQPENDYIAISNIFYSGTTREVIKKINAFGFTKTDPFLDYKQ